MRLASLSLVLLVAVAVVSLGALWPRVTDGQTPVSLANLQRHVAIIAAEPHPVGSAANQRVRDYLLGELRGLGLEPQVQAGSMRNFRGIDIAVENIVCVIPGTRGSAGDGVILASHYDSAPRAPGAGDDAAAVAATLEVARLLREKPPARDVILLITDGEEAGLVGAQVFARQHPDAMGASLVLNFEGRGTGGPSIMFETAGLSRELLATYAAVSPQPITSSMADEVYRLMPNNTDFTVFARMGLHGLNFAFIGGYENYHTPRDDPDHLGDATLLHHAAQAWALTDALANSDVRGRRPADRLVFFDLLGFVVVRYGMTLAWLLAVAAVLLTLAAWVRLRPRITSVLLWLGLYLLHLVGVAAWVHLVILFLPISKESHRWTPLAFAAAGLLVIAGLVMLPRARRHHRAALVAMLAWFTTLAVLATAYLPGASYTLLWPALLMGVATLLPRWRRRLPALSVAAALATLILLPLAWLDTVAMRIDLLAVGAADLALLAWLWRIPLSPLLRRRWTISAVCLLLAAGGMAVVALI